MIRSVWKARVFWTAFLGLAGCTSNDPSQPFSLLSRLQPTPTVKVISVSATPVPFTFSAMGKAEPSDRFAAKAPGRVQVEKFFVEAGATVQAGDLLVKFESETNRLQLAKVNAEIRESEAALGYLQKISQGREPGQNEAEEAVRPELLAIDERTTFYQAVQDRAKAEVELLNRLTDISQINTPMAGTVLQRQVSEGSVVDEDQVLIEVIRMDPVHFVFKAPADDLVEIEKGGEIAVKFAALTGQTFTGELSAAEAEGGSAEVKIQIANPDGIIKSEMKGDVTVKSTAMRKIIVIPEKALVRTDRSVYVYKVEKGVLKKVPVVLGSPQNGQPVVKDGLSEGDTLVVEPSSSLKDGLKVQTDETDLDHLIRPSDRT